MAQIKHRIPASTKILKHVLCFVMQKIIVNFAWLSKNSQDQFVKIFDIAQSLNGCCWCITNYVVIIRHYFVFLQSVFDSHSEWLFFSYVWARTPNQEGLWILWSNFVIRQQGKSALLRNFEYLFIINKVINSTNKYFFNYCRSVLSVQNYQAYLSSSSSRLRLTEAPELFSAGSLVPGLVHHTHNNGRISSTPTRKTHWIPMLYF